MAAVKTMYRLNECYVWPGMRGIIKKRLQRCATCLVHNRHPERHPFGEMPLARTPMQFVSADLIGPLPLSTRGNRYALNIIDHCSLWCESYPLPDKTNQSVWNAFADQFISRHAVPAVLLTDRGGEFTAHEFEEYLKEMGIEHRTTTPYHPASNGRIEKANRTLKEILQKLVNNQNNRWEERLGDALLAYRVAVSSVTGYSPYFVLYGRHSRAPLSRLLRPEHNGPFGNRLDDLARTFKEVRSMTEDSRKYNRERLNNKQRL